MDNLEKYLDGFGEKGSLNRLKAIASLNLGQRSDIAKKVISKRFRRKEIMDLGFTFEQSVLIVNNEFNNLL